ncbi:type VI secretion system tube protein TssD, partial [Escherichia coli]
HGLNRDQNVNHHHLTIKKPIDKASPLLGKAICDNELLTCDFSFYRTNKFGINELFYKIKLTGAKISDIHVSISHIVVDNSVQPEESVSFSYESIIWEHCSAGTSAYSLWEDRLF